MAKDLYEENDTLRQALIELRSMTNEMLASFTPPDEDEDDDEDDEDKKKEKNEDGDQDEEDGDQDEEDDEDGLQV